MLKRLSIILFATLLFAATSSARKWNIDQVHSTISFSVKHLVITKTGGRFDDYSGYVMFDGKDLEKGTVDITIQVASINTDNQMRDEHLRSADFFNVEKYPVIIFKSKKIIKGDENKFSMIGNLTIKDITKEVTLDSEFNGAITGPMGKTRAGFSAHTKINRQDFNVAWSNKLKDGSLIVANEIEINLEIELIETNQD